MSTLKICALPGCNEPVERTGQDFCSRQHRQLSYVHRKRQGDTQEKTAASTSVYAKSAGEASQHLLGVDKAPADALRGAVTEEMAIGSPVVAMLSDKWRVIFDDSPTPRHRQWVLQRSSDGRRGIEWTSVSFCQTRSGLVQAIAAKVCRNALVPIPAEALAAIASLPERTYETTKTALLERLERDDMLIAMLTSNQNRSSRIFGQVRVEPLLYGMLIPQVAAVNEINLGLFDRAGGKLDPQPKEDFHEAVRRQLRDMDVVPVSESELTAVLRKKGFLLWGDHYDPEKARKAAR